MTFEKFEKMIDLQNKHFENSRKLYKDFGIDLINHTEDLHRIISILTEEVFTKAGCDWIWWWLYESEKCSKIVTYEHKEYDLEKIESLWNFLNEFYLSSNIKIKL